MSSMTGLPLPILQMGRSRTDEADYRRIAESCGVDVSDVRRAVQSFFEVIVKDASALPFDNPRRIFKKAAFDWFIRVRNIPYIGRIGPVFSRYRKWRANEAKTIVQKPRALYSGRKYTEEDIEHIAECVLSGQPFPEIEKKRGSDLFNRVWVIDTEGKRSARQVIPKE